MIGHNACDEGKARERPAKSARTRRLVVMKGSLPPAAAICGASPAMTLSTTFLRMSLRGVPMGQPVRVGASFMKRGKLGLCV